MKIERLKGIWRGMNARCRSKNDPNYGGRGIKVCEEWKDFETFKAWALSHGYNSELASNDCTIDRINVNGNYEPSNCRWVSRTVQARNKRNTKYIEINGIKRIATEWAEIYDIPIDKFYKRLRNGDKGEYLIRPCKKFVSPAVKMLRELRGDKTILEMKYKSGLSYFSILDYEKGKRYPNAKAQRKLAKYFNRPVEDFYCNIGD